MAADDRAPPSERNHGSLDRPLQPMTVHADQPTKPLSSHNRGLGTLLQEPASLHVSTRKHGSYRVVRNTISAESLPYTDAQTGVGSRVITWGQTVKEYIQTGHTQVAGQLPASLISSRSSSSSAMCAASQPVRTSAVVYQ